MNKGVSGCDYRQVHTTGKDACATACCADPKCASWDWDSNLTSAQAPAMCAAKGTPFSCCWLKACAGLPQPAPCGGAPHCSSWSGATRTPPPPTCPDGTVYLAGFSCTSPMESGTPRDPGLPADYDCAARAHMWAFGKATLPARGSFKTAFDALQLSRCPGVENPPSAEDAYIPPTFPTTASGAAVIFVDANAVNADGDGSKATPFATLEAGVAAAAAEGTSLSGSISTILTILSWIYAGIYMCRALPSLVCA